MFWSRTYKFSSLEDLVRTIRQLDPGVRVWDPEALTLRITIENPNRDDVDRLYTEHGGDPIGEWEDKYR